MRANQIEKIVKNETMLYSSDWVFARDNGGIMTQKVLDALSESETFNTSQNKINCVIDTRVHMLKEGWIPAIGGWHCDAIPRGTDGQPDFDDPDIDKIKHWLYIYDHGTGSLTQFVRKNPGLGGLIEYDRNVWATYSKHIENNLDTYEPFTPAHDQLVQFSARDFHKGVPATGSGWRYFFRISCHTKTYCRNEIRKQVQTYIPNEHYGW